MDHDKVHELIDKRLKDYGFTRADVSAEILEAAYCLLIDTETHEDEYRGGVLDMLINVAGAE